MKKLFITLTLIAGMVFNSQAQMSKQNVVEIAAANDNFSTLVTAVKAADLAGALSGEGPFTVFAPTNTAFGKIDGKTLNSLLEPKNKETLQSILTYHVISGNLQAKDVVAALKKGKGKAAVKTLNGQEITVLQKDGKIWLKDAKGNYSEIVKTDIMGSNGVIHVIDTVVMPN